MILCKYIKKKHSFCGVKIFETFKGVFLALSFFKVGELSGSKSTAPILLKFYTIFPYLNYEVTLSSFFLFQLILK